MAFTADVAAGLGDKLASLELTDAEGQLLHALLADGIEDTTGFVMSSASGSSVYDASSPYLALRVINPLPTAWKPVSDGYVVTQDLQD